MSGLFIPSEEIHLLAVSEPVVRSFVDILCDEFREQASLGSQVFGIAAIGVDGEEVPEVIVLLEIGLEDGELSNPWNGIEYIGVPVPVEAFGPAFGQEFAELFVEDSEVPDRWVIIGLSAVQLAD